jgi:hypothetical protein
LALCLLILYLPVLQLVAHYIPTAGAERAADCGPCARMAHSGADYRASAGTQQSADACAFFALAQGLSGASSNQQSRSERKCRRS